MRIYLFCCCVLNVEEISDCFVEERKRKIDRRETERAKERMKENNEKEREKK